MSTDQFIHGKILDEDIEKLNLLIGYVNPTLGGGSRVTNEPYYRTVTADAIRNFAHGLGDDNPLYCSPAYGAASRWCTQIATPTFRESAAWDKTPRPDADLRRRARGALRGVQLFFSGSETFFYRPVQPGDVLTKSHPLMRVEAKVSEFSGGRSVITHNGGPTVNCHGEVVEFNRRWYVHTERDGSARKAKDRSIELGSYTDDDLVEVDLAYENEFVRGRDTLYYEDVNIGDELPRMVKGPLTVSDIIGMHMGSGWGPYLVGALKLNYQNRKLTPGFYGKNDWGGWDCMQRVHWDPAFAKAIGNATTYDFGNMRIAWVGHALTNFVGDDAWIHRFRCELRKFNFVGDTTWLVGEVTDKRVDPLLGPVVEIDVRCVNQRNEVTLYANATVQVASHTTGLAALPPVPDNVAVNAPEPHAQGVVW